MKVIQLSKDASLMDVKKYCTTENSVWIRDTGWVFIRSDNTDVIAYSKTDVPIHGSRADIKSHNKMVKDGYKSWYGMFSIGDFNTVMEAKKVKKLTSKDIEITKKISLNTQRYPEYGVELELESKDRMTTEQREMIQRAGGILIQDVGSDPSVKNGCEIRFNHPRMSGWKYKDISALLKLCKENGMKTDSGTAGMHIHISRKDIKQITTKFRYNLETMQQILYPINCRQLVKADGREIHYGVRDNIYRDQNSEFGTLEIRAWNSTLNPKMFLARIKFCKTFTNWLSATANEDICIESFFNFMDAKEKRNYAYMLNSKENPHKWGFPAKAINALLS